MDRPSWQAPEGVHSFSMNQQGSSHENSPSHARSRAGRFNVFSDSLETSPPTATRVHRQETLYPQLHDENDGNSLRPTEQYAQSGGNDRRESQKPSSGAAQPRRREGREPFTDITRSANNNASQPASSIPVAGTAQTNTTNPTAQPIPQRTFREGPPSGTQAYLKPYKHVGKPRFAGNGHLAEYSSLILTHPQVVQEWQNNSTYTKEEISKLLQFYVQVSQTTNPKTVYDIMDKRSLHQSMWHNLDHRVFHRSTGGIPPLGSVIPNQPVADTSVNQFQPDFADGGQGYEFRHHPRNWEQLPIGTTLSDMLDRYPNHIKHEHLDAFAAHGISANQMWNLVPDHLKNLYKSAYLVKTTDEANLFFKRMSQRKNMVVTRYGGAAYNAMVMSEFKLRDPGQSVQTRRAREVSVGFIADPADWLDYQHQQFSAPSVVRRNEDTYKRDEAAAKKKKPATKKETAKSKKSATKSSDTKQTRRRRDSRTDTTSVIDPQLTQSTGINDRQARRSAVDDGFAPPAPSKKRRYVDSDDDDDEERMPNNDFEPPQKRQRVDSFRSYPVSQPPPPRQYIDRDQLLQARYDGPVYYGYAPLNRQSSNSRVGPLDAPGNMARPQLAPRQVRSTLQPQPANSPQPSVVGQKRGRDDFEEQHNDSLTQELIQPAAKKLKQTAAAAASGIAVSSTCPQPVLSQAGKPEEPQEETLDDPGARGWFDVGSDDQAADYNQPDSFTEMLEYGLRGTEWASTLNTGSVPELIEPSPLSSDSQHTGNDISGQDPKLAPREEQELLESITDYQQYAEFDSVAPPHGSPPAMAHDNIEAIYQQPPPKGFSPGPSKTSKRGRDEFEEDVQNSQEPSVGRPLKKLKQTTASSRGMAADTRHASQDSRSVNGGGSGRVERNSMPQDVQEVEPSVQTAGDLQLNVANGPFTLTSIEGTTDNSLAFLGDLDHSNPHNSAGDLFTLGGSSSSAPFLADDTAGADFEAEFEAIYGAPSGSELGDAAGGQGDNWPR